MSHSCIINLICFVVTVTIETLVLLKLLSPHHSLTRKLFSGFWLTACTYPIVILVLPFFFDPIESKFTYQLIAELFAGGFECYLFWSAFNQNAEKNIVLRDIKAVILANLISYSSGLLVSPVLGWLVPGS